MTTTPPTIARIPRVLTFAGDLIPVEQLGVGLPFARKPASLAELCADGHETIYITETVAMTAEAFDTFAADFYAPQPWLNGKGGSVDGGHLCIEVRAPGRPILYVDPSGCEYACYVARLG